MKARKSTSNNFAFTTSNNFACTSFAANLIWSLLIFLFLPHDEFYTPFRVNEPYNAKTSSADMCI